MGPPELKWKLILEEAQRAPDGSGGFVETWVALGELWGEIVSRGVSQGGIPAGPSKRIRSKITVRGAPEGNPRRPKVGQRLRSGDRGFAIDAVAERDGAGTYLTLWTTEEVLS